MKESGKITNVEKKKTPKGKEYVLIELNGEKHSVWNNLELADNLEVGAMATIDYDQNGQYRNVNTVELAEENVQKETPGCTHQGMLKPPVQGKVHVAGVTLGMAINNANNWISKRAQGAEITKELWAEIVCDHTEALLAEMQKRNLLR